MRLALRRRAERPERTHTTQQKGSSRAVPSSISHSAGRSQLTKSPGKWDLSTRVLARLKKKRTHSGDYTPRGRGQPRGGTRNATPDRGHGMPRHTSPNIPFLRSFYFFLLHSTEGGQNASQVYLAALRHLRGSSRRLERATRCLKQNEAKEGAYDLK